MLVQRMIWKVPHAQNGYNKSDFSTITSFSTSVRNWTIAFNAMRKRQDDIFVFKGDSRASHITCENKGLKSK